MDKIFTMKLKQEQSDILSGVVSEFLSCIEDRCDGAFAMGYKVDKKLDFLNLYVVTSDLDLIKTINGKILSSSVCDVKIIGIPTCEFISRTGIFRVDKLLKSGKIIYDKDGSLRFIKKNLDTDKSVGYVKNTSAVNIKPPLQYIKK